MDEREQRFIDWAQELDETEKHRKVRIGFLGATIAAFLMFMVFAIPIYLLLTPIFLIVWLVARSRKTTTWDFSLDGDVVRASVVYNQKRRRKKMKFRVADIVYIVRKIEKNTNGKTLYYCDVSEEGYLCTMVINYKGKKVALVIPQYDDFLDAVRTRVR